MTEVGSNIPSSAQYFLIVWVIFVASTLLLFSKKHRLFPLTLALSVFSLASAFALFTPYLYRWDEQFHALIGKNLSINPFHPKLINVNPALWDSSDWANTYTWLHKQPLFLYQIALSIKMFGASVYAVRLPSILLHVIGTLALYDMGKMLLNRNLGFLIAMVFSVSAFPLELLSGRIGTDHNDSVFMIYILLSFWAWFKFYTSENEKWVKWIGIFVGSAILTKWLVGLLIFAIWSVWLISNKLKKKNVDFRSFFKALAVALLISLPWQIFTFSRFPKEAKFEMEYNNRHFFEAIEGHRGDWGFHFLNIEALFFNHWLVLCLLFLSIFSLRFLQRKSKFLVLAILFSATLVYLFFSFAETKMGTFIAPVFPLLLLILCLPVVVFIERIQPANLSKVIFYSVIIFAIFFMLKPAEIAMNYGFDPSSKKLGEISLMKSQWKFFENNMKNQPKELVINAHLRGYGSVSWQFQNGTLAMANIPSEKEINTLQAAGYKISCVKWDWGQKIPDYVRSNSEIVYIQFE